MKNGNGTNVVDFRGNTFWRDRYNELKALVVELESSIELSAQDLAHDLAGKDQMKREAKRLEGNYERLREDFACLQRHRDAWRGHAYGKRPRPDDFMEDGRSLAQKTRTEIYNAVRELIEDEVEKEALR